jgi:hypothetical protein
MSSHYFGRSLAVVLSAILFTVPAPGRAAPTTLGSDAELWLQQSSAEKAAYLDGLCAGLHAGGQMAGELMCVPGAPVQRGQRPRWRFCAVRFGGGRDASGILPTGSDILDKFYAHPAHSDVPVILAVQQFNDQACHESNVGARIPAVQAQRKCMRQLINMHEVSAEARAAQQSVCDNLR